MDYKTYHYGDNGINDNGWGGVVLIETYKLLSLVIKNIITRDNSIPSLSEILLFLKKNRKSSKSRELWIEPYDISRYLNFLIIR